MDEIEKLFEQENTPERKRERALQSKYNPDVKFWVCRKNFIGSLAKWAVMQSPYSYPENLETVLLKFSDHIAPYFDNLDMKLFSVFEVEEFVKGNLITIPEFLNWNERKNGREGMGFVSRFDGARNPDDDFIDLDALYRNISHDIYNDNIEYAVK